MRYNFFHLRSSNGPKNYYNFSNSYNYIVSHITQKSYFEISTILTTLKYTWHIFCFYSSQNHSVEVSLLLICFVICKYFNELSDKIEKYF